MGDGSCVRCLERTPYSSLVAYIMALCGIGIWCAVGTVAVFDLFEFFEDPPYSLDVSDADVGNGTTNAWKIKWSILGISWGETVVIFFLSLILLIIGFVSTFQAKRQIYYNKSNCCSSHYTISFYIFLTYLVFVVWLLINVLSSYPLMYDLMFKQYCELVVVDGDTSAILDFSYYGVPILGTIGGDDLTTFCEWNQEQLAYWAIVFAAACVVTISLVHFLMSLSSNYTQMKDGLKRKDYEIKRYREEKELNDLTIGNSQTYLYPR